MRDQARITVKDTQITVNPRTIRVGSAVYPIDNLSVFGVGEVSKYPLTWAAVVSMIGGLGVVWMFVLFVGVVGSIASESVGVVAGILLLFVIPSSAMGLLVVKLVDPKHQGLMLAPNSGDRQLFVTQDLAGVESITTVVGAILDSEITPQSSYVINVSNSQVSGNLLVDSHAHDVVSAPQNAMRTPPPPSGATPRPGSAPSVEQ